MYWLISELFSLLIHIYFYANVKLFWLLKFIINMELEKYEFSNFFFLIHVLSEKI